MVNLMVNLFLKKSANNPRQSCLMSGKLVRTKDVYKCRKTFSYNKFSPEATISPIPSGFKNQSLDFKELSNVAIPFDEGFHGAFSLNLGGNLPVKSHYQKKNQRIFPKIRRYTGNVREKKLSNWESSSRMEKAKTTNVCCDAFPHPTM